MTVNYEKLAVDAVADAIAITDYLDPYCKTFYRIL